ncbi:unnamed protein product [Polarella glacialis]|uniref:Uncharacterized protein n=1 Tax=Polarella glacialis TaxID=89957 RepID=A0A813DJT4_POLGL|nr:unnamed protein product [Polarella glacialis]CAE8718940.1 unnamed protein product [Polarella glacialis]
MGGGASKPSAKYIKVAHETVPEERKASPPMPEPWAAPEEATPREKPVKLSEELRAEVLAVLEVARAPNLATAPAKRLKLLAESAKVEEYAANTVLELSELWDEGQRVVLSGEASVMLREGLAVAVLRTGDSWGWPAARPASSSSLRRSSDFSLAELISDVAWESSEPQVVVSGAMPLRVARITEDRAVSKSAARSDQPSGQEVSTSLATSHDLGGQQQLSDQLAKIWLSGSPPPIGIGEMAASVPQAHFQASLWAPLLIRLESLLEEVRRRKAAGFRIHDCFPLQGHQIVELTQHVQHLTEIWYGSARGGNLSVVYRWFMQCMEVLGVTAYSYSSLPRERSADGWAVIVDGGARSAALKGKGSSDSLYVATGGIAQRQGRSAIDNTVLRNVFLPHEARELLLGKFIRKFICKLFVLRQNCILRALARHLQMDLEYLAHPQRTGRAHCIVRAVLNCVPLEAFRQAGVDPEGACFRDLRRRGVVLAGFGQLDGADQKAMWGEGRRLLRQRFGDDAAGEPCVDAPDIFERFVAWQRDFPGGYFEQNRLQHILVMLAGMFSNRIVVIRRSVMEKMTLARYFPLPWSRVAPLWGVAKGPVPFQVRTAGKQEVSHVRANECPYALGHGMSMSGGGFASDARMVSKKKQSKLKRKHSEKYTLLMEMQWVRDPSANVENWFITDIEKIVQEAWQLNPHGPRAMLLEGETFVNVGQNPKVGSSIQQTQHTQLCQSSTRDYPILRMASSEGPRFSAKLRASVDLLDVGVSEQCGLIVRLRTPFPTAEPVLRFLVELRHHLLVRFESESIDFLMLALSDETGEFVLMLAPIPQLVKLGDQHADLATWVNPLTGESSESAGLEESRIDFGKGVGHFLVSKPALRAQLLAGGEDTLRRIWGFNYVPGLRAVVDSFIEAQDLFADATVQVA